VFGRNVCEVISDHRTEVMASGTAHPVQLHASKVSLMINFAGLSGSAN
jgi:hypothetical protein